MNPLPSRPALRGFTLLEMLTAMAVLALMIAIIGQIAAQSQRTVQASMARLNTAESARDALLRIDTDFSSMIQTDWAPVILTSEPIRSSLQTMSKGQLGGVFNHSLTFLINARPIASSSRAFSDFRLMWANYGIREGTEGRSEVPSLGLRRAFGGSTWDVGGNNPQGDPALVLLNASQRPEQTSLSSRTHAGLDNLMAPGVVSLAVCVQIKETGEILPFENGSRGNVNFPKLTDEEELDIFGENLRSNQVALDLPEISAIIVGIAVLDEDTISLLRDLEAGGANPMIERIAYALGQNFPQRDETPLEAWDLKNSLEQDSRFPSLYEQLSTITPAGEIIANNIRFYQRTYVINR
ncbi:MAG: type II secretion system protein [Verrucomicrobiota bacterium]